jgi:hypothetical protein
MVGNFDRHACLFDMRAIFHQTRTRWDTGGAYMNSAKILEAIPFADFWKRGRFDTTHPAYDFSEKCGSLRALRVCSRTFVCF